MPAVNSPDAYSPQVADIVIITGVTNNDPTTGTAFIVPAHEYLQSITVNIGQGRVWSAELTLFDQGSETLEDAVINSATPLKQTWIYFKWGWDGPGGVAVLPTYVGFVASYGLEVTTSGTSITFSLLPAVMSGLILDKQTRSWPAGTLITDIVKGIAISRGWSITDGGTSTIQDSPTTVWETVQSGESDLTFINNYLAPYALDAQGRGGFVLHCGGDNIVRFHNDYFGAPTEAARYIFSRDDMGEVVSFHPNDMSMFAAILGGGNNAYTGVNSDAGTTAETATKFAQGAPPTATPTTVLNSGYRRDLGNGVHSYMALNERDPGMATAKLSSQYALMTKLAYNATLVVRGTHAVGIMDWVRVDFMKRDGTPHYLSGVFQVFTLSHSFSGAGWTTTMALQRAGTNQADGLVQIPPGASYNPLPNAQTQDAGTVAQPGSSTGATTQIPVQQGSAAPYRPQGSP